MKLFFSAILIIPTSISASRNNHFQSHTPAFSLPVGIASSAKDELLSFSKQQFAESKTGVFLSDYESKQQLKKLTAELEAVCDPPMEASQDLMLGDWKLLCTIATPTDDISSRMPAKRKMKKTKKGLFGLPLPSPPEFLKDSLDPIQDNLRQSVEVIQRIRKVEDFDGDSDADVLNRVDNVIQFTPLSMENILNGANLNLNPLEVTKSKVSLVHSAKVESVSPLLRTKLVLKSYVLTVAGTSQYLEPEGADVLGLNVPLGDLFNFGSFDTTYVDEEMRVSRSKVGLVEQLRVFVRMSEDEEDDVEKSEIAGEVDVVTEDAEISTDEAEEISEEDAEDVETTDDEEIEDEETNDDEETEASDETKEEVEVAEAEVEVAEEEVEVEGSTEETEEVDEEAQDEDSDSI